MVNETDAAPATPSRREEAAQDKVTRIVEAAVALFAERGFHGTAVPEVAKRAGVGAFVGLMKAQVLGYIAVSEESLRQAEGVCWEVRVTYP